MSKNIRILWADDEVDLLKPHILFLEKKSYDIDAVTNGEDALDAIDKIDYDVVFLDENMPGLNGLETLEQLKEKQTNLPVVMITKSEEEYLMNEAIGSKIADYLIKPVNPKQILLSLKKILEKEQLVTQKTSMNYQKNFNSIQMAFFERLDFEDWLSLYKKLIYHEFEILESHDQSMLDILNSQKQEANVNFTKWIADNYIDWINTPLKDDPDRPVLSPELLPQKVFPELKGEQETIFFFLVDCLRYDQWKSFEKILSRYFKVTSEDAYLSIVPTATQYARNAIFSGLHPLEIEKKYPKYWKNDHEEGGKNLFEKELLVELITRSRLDIKYNYTKIITNEQGKDFSDNIQNYLHNDINFVVVNFIDMLSHSRTEMNLIKELAPDEAAYRSISESWLKHSAFLEGLKKLQGKNVKIIITADHGSIRVQKPVKIIGDKNTTTNLRYKQGKNLNYDHQRYLFTIDKPAEAKLPKMTVSSTYVFSSEDYFFAYPNNYNYYANYYKDTFQHGGISLEEMLVPFVILEDL